MAKSRKKLNPNRFQKQDDKGLFSFDTHRRQAFKWGLVAGAAGGVFMLQPENLILQIVGVFVIVLISNYHINKISRRIPRLHATIISFLGVILALFAMVIVSTLFLTLVQRGGGR